MTTSVPAAVPEFRSAAEFREVMDRVFTLMDDDDAMGPRLRRADLAQRFAFPDVGLVVSVRAARDDEGGNLHWAWTDELDWVPAVSWTMSSSTANRYFQGRENVAQAIAHRRMRTTGDVRAALALLPITKAVHGRYRALVADEYPHLVA